MSLRNAIIDELIALTRTPGYLYVLCDLFWTDFFLKPADIAQINWRERLSFQEANYILGLTVKHQLDLTLPSQTDLQTNITATRTLLEQLQHTHFQPEPGRRFPSEMNIATEAIFYDHP